MRPTTTPYKRFFDLLEQKKKQNKFLFAVVTLGYLLWEYLWNPRKRSPHYKTHHQWRVQLLKRRTKRLFRRIWHWLGFVLLVAVCAILLPEAWFLFAVLVATSIAFTILGQRGLSLLLAAGVSLSLAIILAKGWPVDQTRMLSTWEMLSDNLSGHTSGSRSVAPIPGTSAAASAPITPTSAAAVGNTGAWNLFTILAGAPIAFAIWYFRDKNNLWQIENARKDINLKDFQKLAEWASGMHLVEDKVTNSDKTSSAESTETTQSRESSQPPPNALLGSPSRRDGSASLQIAAVVQLQAFLNGEFGKQFQKPAFTLLSSIWLALVRPHCDAWQKIKGDSDAYKAWRDKWEEISNTPLAQAITRTLLDHHGQALRQHRESLPGLLLAGMNSRLPNLDPLELDGFNLQGIQLQGANLNNAQLQGADLRWAQLQGADLTEAQLQGADLHIAQLQGAYLTEAQLQGTTLLLAQLQSTNIFNPQFDHHTSWSLATTDATTLVEIRATFLEKKLPLLTHALRLKLRDRGLELPEWRYTEFATVWTDATPAQKDAALAQAGTQTYFEHDPI
jgi:hypothetical protein